MTDKERYVFKLYNIGAPTKRAMELFGSAVGDMVFMSSPYVGEDYDQAAYDVNNYHMIDEEIHEGKPDHRLDYLNRRSKPINENDGHSNYDLHLPHRGISVIGLSDPRFSFYSGRDIGDSIIKVINGVPVFNRELINKFDKKTQNELLYMLNNFAETELDNFNVDLSKLDKQTLDSILSNIPYAKNAVLNYYLHTDDKNFRAKDPRDLSNYDFGYKKSVQERVGEYRRLLERIAETQNDTKATGLVLATLPESAIYNVKDVIDGKMRAQRDFPEELVVRKLIPRQVWDTPYADVDYDYGDKNNGPIIKSGMIDSVDINKALASLNDLEAAGKPPEYIDEMARDYINKKFEIDPDQIHSDETKKIIFDDISNWYKGYCDKKKTEHSNILSGIKELGQ